jgi:hypothetical protein
VAKGYTPAFSPKLVDPRAGGARILLHAHDLDRREPDRVLRGRVLSEGGGPVERAEVQPFGFGWGSEAFFGGLDGFDPLALTDDKGEFRLGMPQPGLHVYLQISAPLFAPRKVGPFSAGTKPNDVTLFTGATVSGRLMKDGRALAGIAMGLAQKSRNVDTFVGDFKAATDSNGRFRISNVPPGEQLVLYGLMGSLRTYGAVGVRDVRTGASDSETNVGDLAVQPSFKLSGRVVLADGKPVPAGIRVVLSREEAWDSQEVAVGANGSFAFDGLPPEQFNLTTSVPGYHLSPKNASLDVLDRLSLSGVVRENTEGIVLLLEPGAWQLKPAGNDQKLLDECNRRRAAPLRGAS